MGENYDKMLINLIDKHLGDEKTSRVLLHSCCAPCSSYVIEFLSRYFDLTILYYNPNISPFDEYEKRKKEQIRFIQEFKTTHLVDIMDCDYDNDLYE